MNAHADKRLDVTVTQQGRTHEKKSIEVSPVPIHIIICVYVRIHTHGSGYAKINVRMHVDAPQT